MPADPSNLTRQPDKSNTVAHTPGPLVVVGEGECWVVQTPNGIIRTALCYFSPRNVDGDCDNALADAQLYAAAPDLLEALKAVLAEEMIYTGAIHETLEKSGQHQELTAKIRAAILRAEGGQ